MHVSASSYIRGMALNISKSKLSDNAERGKVISFHFLLMPSICLVYDYLLNSHITNILSFIFLFLMSL